MKLKIVRLDHDGYNGRDHFALDSDVGTEVLVIGLDVHVTDITGSYLGPALTKDGAAAFPTIFRLDDSLEYMWTCLTANGRTLQLMGHEVEVAR